LSPPPLPSSLAAIKLANPGLAGKWPFERREREITNNNQVITLLWYQELMFKTEKLKMP